MSEDTNVNTQKIVIAALAYLEDAHEKGIDVGVSNELLTLFKALSIVALSGTEEYDESVKELEDYCDNLVEYLTKQDNPEGEEA